jgi:glycosyltransferase involved in cell wall biosynthesis
VLVFGSGFAPQYIRNANIVSRFLIELTIGMAGKIICRNEAMRDALASKGAQQGKVIILEGFLGIASSIEAACPEGLKAFVETHSPILGATVSVPHSGALEPEYGVDEAVEALHVLRQVYPRLGLIVIGADALAGSRIYGIEKVGDHVLFTGPLPHGAVLNVMRKLTVFLRPTCTDGDSSSVREALAVGTPVVASNTDYRPKGVITFRKGDVADLTAKVRHTIDHLDQAILNLKRLGHSDNAERLLNIYKELTFSCNGETSKVTGSDCE